MPTPTETTHTQHMADPYYRAGFLLRGAVNAAFVFAIVIGALGFCLKAVANAG